MGETDRGSRYQARKKPKRQSTLGEEETFPLHAAIRGRKIREDAPNSWARRNPVESFFLNTRVQACVTAAGCSKRKAGTARRKRKPGTVPLIKSQLRGRCAIRGPFLLDGHGSSVDWFVRFVGGSEIVKNLSWTCPFPLQFFFLDYLFAGFFARLFHPAFRFTSERNERGILLLGFTVWLRRSLGEHCVFGFG